MILTTAHAFGQSRFGEDSHLTDVIVKVQPGTLELPERLSASPVNQVTIDVPELSGILARHGATEILRSFPGANPADTLMFNEFNQPIRLINRTLVYRFRFPRHVHMEQVVAELSGIPNILFAYRVPQYQSLHMPNHSIFTQESSDPIFSRGPNDTSFAGHQWNLRHTGQGSQPPVTSQGGRADIRALEAWSLFTGSATSRIGILDTGVMLTHEDLVGKVTGDDYTNLPHGTQVAGVSAAHTNNQLGIAGVDWHAQLISRNIEDFQSETIYDAVISAIVSGAQILNNSWGGGDGTDDYLLRSAFAAAYNSNVLSTAGTGRANIPSIFYPARLPHVMAVGSSTYENLRSAAFSSYGNGLDVVAPGGSGLVHGGNNTDIYTTDAILHYTNFYRYVYGTSFATPHVSGLASLIRGYAQQQHGITLYNDDLRQVIQRSTDRIREGDPYIYNSDGWNEEVGYGRINAHNALVMVRDNSFHHYALPIGYVHSYSNLFPVPILNAPGLSPNLYYIRRYEIRRPISFSGISDFQVWARSINDTGVTGWSDIPTYAQQWTEVVPGSVTPNSAVLRTYLYEVWNHSIFGPGSYLGWWPAHPQDVTFAFTLMGNIETSPFAGGADFTGDELYVASGRENSLPDVFESGSNHPNPFSTTTSLQIALPESAEVRLVVYDVLGREVIRPVDGPLEAGYHTIHVSASDWPSGVYFYRVEAVSTESGQRFHRTRQMTVAR